MKLKTNNWKPSPYPEDYVDRHFSLNKIYYRESIMWKRQLRIVHYQNDETPTFFYAGFFKWNFFWRVNESNFLPTFPILYKIAEKLKWKCPSERFEDKITERDFYRFFNITQ